MGNKSCKHPNLHFIKEIGSLTKHNKLYICAIFYCHNCNKETFAIRDNQSHIWGF